MASLRCRGLLGGGGIRYTRQDHRPASSTLGGVTLRIILMLHKSPWLPLTGTGGGWGGVNRGHSLSSQGRLVHVAPGRDSVGTLRGRHFLLLLLLFPSRDDKIQKNLNFTSRKPGMFFFFSQFSWRDRSKRWHVNLSFSVTALKRGILDVNP